jgi:cobalamin biosynthesis Mg chelatase CobN
MNINVNVKRKYRINGKEYNSVEEMPDDIREALVKATLQSGGEQRTGSRVVRTKIIFNGTEYESIDAMPPDIRRLYEDVMKAAESGTAPPESDIARLGRTAMGGESISGVIREVSGRKPSTESSFSPRALIVSIVLAALTLLLYYLFRAR